jgi:hypothetical protein
LGPVITGLDHVQVAAPPGCEAEARGFYGLHVLAERLTLAGAPVHWDAEIPGVARFFTEDPWGNRIELLAAS